MTQHSCTSASGVINFYDYEGIENCVVVKTLRYTCKRALLPKSMQLNGTI